MSKSDDKETKDKNDKAIVPANQPSYFEIPKELYESLNNIRVNTQNERFHDKATTKLQLNALKQIDEFKYAIENENNKLSLVVYDARNQLQKTTEALVEALPKKEGKAIEQITQNINRFKRSDSLPALANLEQFSDDMKKMKNILDEIKPENKVVKGQIVEVKKEVAKTEQEVQTKVKEVKVELEENIKKCQYTLKNFEEKILETKKGLKANISQNIESFRKACNKIIGKIEAGLESFRSTGKAALAKEEKLRPGEAEYRKANPDAYKEIKGIKKVIDTLKGMTVIPLKEKLSVKHNTYTKAGDKEPTKVKANKRQGYEKY